MAGLWDLLSGAQAAPARQQLGKQFGLDEKMTQVAMQALIPALSAGLKSNSEKSGGLESLLGALQTGQHDRYIDDPSRLADARSDGNGILGNLLGSKEMSRNVAQQAAAKTGLDSNLLKQLLPIVATMAMGALSKRGKEPDVLSQLAGALGGGGSRRQPSGLGDLLGGVLSGGRRETRQPAPSGGLSALFDADGDGSAIDDIFKMVMSRRQ